MPQTPRSGADLDVDVVGSGPTVVLVHGSIVDARRTWRHQLDLATAWTLCRARGAGGSRVTIQLSPRCSSAASGSTAAARGLEPSAFLRHFRAGVHSAHVTPAQLPDWLEHGARLASRERPPWEAEIPFEQLRSGAFPKLVISGGHSPAFETVCDVLAARIGAERAILPGRGHTIPSLGAPYNALVHDFLTRPETESRTGVDGPEAAIS